MVKTTLIANFLLLLFLGTSLAQGTDCNYNATPCEAYANADAVFVGKVLRITPETIQIWQRDKDYDQTAVVTVEKIFKGIKAKTLVLHQLGNTNAPKFVLGSRYLFYASVDRVTKNWTVKRCGRTRMANYVQDDLRYLSGLPGSASKTRVAGEIVRYEKDAENPQGTSERLGGIKIKLVGEAKAYEAVTDVDGVYEINDVLPGSYVIEPVIPKGLMLMGVMHYGPFDRSTIRSLGIELKKGECSGATILLTTDPMAEKPKIGS